MSDERLVVPTPIFSRGVEAAAYYTELTPAELMTEPWPEATRGRWALMQVMREAGWSSPRIGRKFGFDHSSVLYGAKKARELAAEPDFRALIDFIRVAVNRPSTLAIALGGLRTIASQTSDMAAGVIADQTLAAMERMFVHEEAEPQP